MKLLQCLSFGVEIKFSRVALSYTSTTSMLPINELKFKLPPNFLLGPTLSPLEFCFSKLENIPRL